MALSFNGTWLEWARSLPHLSISKELAWSCAILVCAYLVSRIHATRAFSRKDHTVEERRQRHVNFRNGIILLTLGLLGFVWGGEIRALILSLAAIAAAAMIVSKEIISCFYGSLIFSFSRLARIGDSIEIGSNRGELLDHDWMSLTLMELSDNHYYSGNIVKVPTSALLATPLVNLSQGGAYRFASLRFHARQEHASAALRIAAEAAAQVCAPWMEQARASVAELMSARLSIAPDVEPKAALVSVDKDSVAVTLRFVAPAGSRASSQAEIARVYFSEFETYLRQDRQTERELDREADLAPLKPTAAAGAPS